VLSSSLAGADRDPASGDLLAGVGPGVLPLGGVVALEARDEVARVRLGIRVLPLRPLAEKGRQRDRGEDADDKDDDEDLDQAETILFPQHEVKDRLATTFP
jgi:hypothetical protein